ncbi:MAG: HAD-IIIA family hydrolase [Acidobacteriaceae bacterium]
MGIGKVAAVFLDRDGVLNPLVLNPATGRMESPLTVNDFHLAEGAAGALLRLQAAGFPLILVSNQPNYALGKCSYAELCAIHAKLVRELEAGGIRFARFCYCLHHPKGATPGYSGVCGCRKPSPRFLLQARDDFGLTLADCWMVGDQPTDTACGRAAGARTIRLLSPQADLAAPGRDPCADFLARDPAEAAAVILAHRPL